jgi:hypothetical protein
MSAAAVSCRGLRVLIARQFRRQLEQALAIAVAQHRHHQAVGRVHGDADVEVLLEHQLLAVERGVEGRIFFMPRPRP